jgi:CRP-like cAMP-binding protein
MTEKSILEQALLQVQNLEEAVKQNAKGILASTMKEELKDLLKESLEEEEKVEDETEVSEQPTSDEEDTDDMSDDDAEADDAEADDAENMDDLDNEPSKDIESLDSEVGGDEMGDEESMDSEDSLELPSDDMGMDDEDVMDMTGASDEEVLKVFKAMKPEDGIVVKKDGNNVEFETADDEYIIKLDGEEESEVEDEFGMEEEMMPSEEESETEEETIYEIEMEEEEMEEEVEATEGESKEDEPKEVEATEAARTFANDVRVPANQGKKFKAGRHEMNEEVENLKKQNAEYKKALILFKEKLNEVAVFNANLAYATRLFTEHSTTKQEKLNILKRFDSVSTMNESKNLFSTIKSELGTKTTVTETVADKISNTPTTSSSTEVLSESKAYENPQFSRIKEMMKKIK